MIFWRIVFNGLQNFAYDVTVTAKYISISPSVLRKYVGMEREPRKEQFAKIKEGLKKLSEALSSPTLIDYPVTAYVKL